MEFKHGNEFGYLSGMQSFHNNHHEDRKFQFFYTLPIDYKIEKNCQRRTANGYDQVRGCSKMTSLKFEIFSPPLPSDPLK